MIEHINLAGERKWYGSDYVEIQKENLDVIQAFFKQYGNCIIQGCEITPNVGTPANFDIAAGIVAINHADGFKVARLAAVTNVGLPGYLSINKTTQTDAYNTTGVQAISNTYTAAFTAGATPAGNTYLTIPAPTTGTPAFFEEALATKALTAWENITPFAGGNSAFTPTGALKMRVNKIARLVYIQGTVTVTPTNNFGIAAGTVVALANIPAKFRPVVDQDFTAYARFTMGGDLYKDAQSVEYMKGLSMTLSAANGLVIRFIHSQQGVATYYVNAVLQLD